MSHGARPYTEISILDLGLAVGLVIICIIASRSQKLDLERDLFIGTVRSLIQLFAIGYLLELIFRVDNVPLAILVLLIMTLVAAHTASKRVKGISGVARISYIAIGGGGLTVLAIMVSAGVIQPKPWYVIPVGGMVLSNAMNAVALFMDRVKSEYDARRGEIETALSLGATSRRAVAGPYRDAVRAAMIPSINALVVVGIVALPGMMTGQIIAGESAVQAVRYQLVVLYMITAAVVASVLIAGALTHRRMFTRAHQFAE